MNDIKTVDEILDRKRELKILNLLAQHFRRHVPIFKEALTWCDQDQETLNKELIYLAGEGLINIKAHTSSTGSGKVTIIDHVAITNDGMNILKGDGGLTAELNVVTVKFHADIIQLLTQRIEQLEGVAPQDKQKYLEQLRTLPADLTKQLVLKVFNKGLDYTPELLGWLQSLGA